jgi:long-chain fatty acid transport protein
MRVSRSVAQFSAALTITIALGPVSVLATDGYFSHGYGTKSKSMAGAGVAFDLGPMSPATNPAAIALGSGGLDINIGLFNPNRQHEVVGKPSGFPGTFGLAPGTVESGSTLFAIPGFGYARNTGKLAFGLTLYGNGGMNTDYDAPVFGAKPTGVNLSQLFVAPTVAFRLGENHALGVTAILAYQMFKAEGLQAFSAFSSDPKNVSNNDTDSSFGGGVRVGYLGNWERFSIGAAYQSRTAMGTFDKYAGLFAEQGGFDIPASWTAGIGIKPTEKVDIAFDVRQVFYGSVKSIANPLLPNLMQAPLGDAGGAGFGWEDMTVVKAGLQYRAGNGWTWRGGYSYGQQPIPGSEMLFNIVAPGVIENQASFGFSREVGRGKFFDFALTRGFAKEISGPNTLEAPGAQTIKLKMDQWDFTFGYSVRF